HLPQNSLTSDPNIVLAYPAKFFPNTNISLNELSFKTISLIALVTAHCVQTFSLIELTNINITKERIRPWHTSGPGIYQPTLILAFFVDKPELCANSALIAYINRTKGIRTEVTKLFIRFKKHYNATQAFFLPTPLDMTSAAYKKGINIETIRNTAGWSETSSVFAKFYNRPLMTSSSVADAILSR
ncbi:hypothetical protein HUJ04_011221, partial [Dendroctonus ponderosae]